MFLNLKFVNNRLNWKGMMKNLFCTGNEFGRILVGFLNYEILRYLFKLLFISKLGILFNLEEPQKSK